MKPNGWRIERTAKKPGDIEINGASQPATTVAARQDARASRPAERQA